MRNRVSICTLIIGLIYPFTQVARGQQSGPVQPPPARIVEESQRSAGGPSESDVATANNPIAPLNAIYFQNYYAPTVYGVPGSDNLLDLRTLVVSGRQIVRATLPISSAEDNSGDQQSGLGDFNVFDAIRVSPAESRNVLAVGPMLTAPTATNSFLGQGNGKLGWLQLAFTRCQEEAHSWASLPSSILLPASILALTHKASHFSQSRL